MINGNHGITNSMSRFEIRFPHRVPLPLLSNPFLSLQQRKEFERGCLRSYLTLMYRWWDSEAFCSPRVLAIISRLSRRPRYTNSVDVCNARKRVHAADSPSREARWNCENREYPGSSSCFRSTRRGNASSDFQNGGGQRNDRFGNDK